MKKKVIQFTQTVSPYQKGEIAGFEPELADKLIAEKKAVEYKEQKKAVKPADPSKTVDQTDAAGNADPTDPAAPAGAGPTGDQ